MDIKEKIANIKHKASRLALKVGTAATLLTGTGLVTSCSNHENADENKDKIENTEGTKTSVVFRAEHLAYHYTPATNSVLFENGDAIELDEKGLYLEAGDTVTYYEKPKFADTVHKVKAVRYKGSPEVKKNVDFGQRDR